MTDHSAGDRTGLSLLGLGCSRIGSFNNPQSLAEARLLIQRALEIGVTVLDTSNIYGQGDSEAQIGRALDGQRDRAFVVTKTGKAFSAKMRVLRPFKPVLRPLLAMRRQDPRDGRQASASIITARREGQMRQDWRPQAFAPSLHSSLRRLRTDRVDGFLLHSPPAEVVAQPQVQEALAELKQAGKVRHFGVSCDDASCLEAALDMAGLTLVQLPWDLIATIDDQQSATIRERQIIVLAREVIRLQPQCSPLEAVARAARHELVDTVLVGTSSRHHLELLAQATA